MSPDQHRSVDTVRLFRFAVRDFLPRREGRPVDEPQHHQYDGDVRP